MMATAVSPPEGFVAHGLALATESGIAARGDRAVVITRVAGAFGGSTVQLMPIGDDYGPTEAQKA